MKTILIIEDEELLSEIYFDTLKKEGYNILIAGSGNKALEYLKETRPDLVILDVKLPDISGTKVLEKIRQKDTELPVIMCTAYDPPDDYELWSSKVSDYITKPFDLGLLKEKIKKVLGS